MKVCFFFRSHKHDIVHVVEAKEAESKWLNPQIPPEQYEVRRQRGSGVDASARSPSDADEGQSMSFGHHVCRIGAEKTDKVRCHHD